MRVCEIFHNLPVKQVSSMDGSQFTDRKKREKRAKWSNSMPKNMTCLQTNHGLHITNMESLNLGPGHGYTAVSGGAHTVSPVLFVLQNSVFKVLCDICPKARFMILRTSFLPSISLNTPTTFPSPLLCSSFNFASSFLFFQTSKCWPCSLPWWSPPAPWLQISTV